MTTITEQVQLQRLIADETERKHASIMLHIEEQVRDLSDDTFKWLHSNRYVNDRVLELFQAAKRHAPPTGWKALFFEHSADDRQRLAAFLKEVKAHAVAMASSKPFAAKPDHDTVIARAKARLEQLAREVNEERANIQREADKKRALDARDRPAVKKAAPLKKPAASTRPTVRSQTTTVYGNSNTVVQTDDYDDGIPTLMQTVLLNTFLNDDSQPAQAQSIVSGGGGDFGGGGATGSWSPATDTSPAADDLGASNFS